MVISGVCSRQSDCPTLERMASRPRPDYLRTTLGPAAGVGVVAAIFAAQEGAGALGSAVVAVAITAVILGMLALKRRF